MYPNIVKAAMFTPFSRGRWGLPISIVSEPGAAKSASIVELCESVGMPSFVIEPGAMGDGAFGVVPVPMNGKIVFPRPEWTDMFVGADGKQEIPGVIFIDELTTAEHTIQKALLGLMLERRIGGFQLPGCVRTVGAYNPPEQAAGGFDLSPPLANRMGHIDWKPPTVDEHAQYMMRGETANGGHVDIKETVQQIEARVMQKWPTASASARGLEIAFLRARSELKNQCPKVGDPKASRPWPSDRSWEMATRALAGAKCHDLTQKETEIFVASFIGEGVSSEFFRFMEEQDLPNPADLLDGKVKWEHDRKRLDRTAAVLSSCAALLTPEQSHDRKKRAERMWDVLANITSKFPGAKDICIPPIYALISANLHTAKNSAKALGDVQIVVNLSKTSAGGV